MQRDAQTLQKNCRDGADGNQPANKTEHFDFPPLFLLQIEQHDDKQEQHHHRAGVNENLHRREEERVQEHEQPGHRNDGQDEKHRARDRVAAEWIGHDEDAAQQRQRREHVK